MYCISSGTGLSDVEKVFNNSTSQPRTYILSQEIFGALSKKSSISMTLTMFGLTTWTWSCHNVNFESFNAI